MPLRTALIMLLAGCAGPIGDPIVEAHRGAAGYWPGNSRTAMHEAIAAGFEGIHLDLGLTADEVPVLASEPWLDPEECTGADGEPLPDRLVLSEHPLEALLPVLCGGVPDPDHVNARVVAEPLMTLDELLVALKDADARTVVHVEVRVGRDTLGADRFATAFLDRWLAADLPNPWYVSADDADAIRAFEDDARIRGLEVHTSLVHPGAGPVLAGELRGALGLESYLELVEEAGADGLTVHWEIAERQQLLALRAAGLTVGLSHLDAPGLLETYARWPADHLVSDYPGDLP